MRRMLVRATTKSYTQLLAELVATLRVAPRAESGDVIEGWLRGQSGINSYWPDDDELRRELASLLAYRRLGRGRLRMVLEAIEDHLRGWVGDAHGLGEQRVVRSELAIEHVLPRKWQTHWALPPGVNERERDSLLHTLGNLTLLGKRLNAGVSNGPWKAATGKGKREALEEHDVLLLNRQLLQSAKDAWTDADIRARTKALTEIILKIWPVPTGHRSSFAEERVATHRKVEVVDLIGAGFLSPGATLHVRRKKHRDRTATVLQDGSLDVNGTVYPTLSAAAIGISGKTENGWYFFGVEEVGKRVRLRDLRDRLLERLAGGEDDDEDDGDDDDDE